MSLIVSSIKEKEEVIVPDLSYVSAVNSKKNLFGEEINLGTNHTFKVIDIVRMVSSILGKKLNLKLNKQKLRPKASEVDVLICDYRKAQKKLNWKPKFKSSKGLKEALKITIDWYKKYHSI